HLLPCRNLEVIERNLALAPFHRRLHLLAEISQVIKIHSIKRFLQSLTEVFRKPRALASPVLLQLLLFVLDDAENPLRELTRLDENRSDRLFNGFLLRLRRQPVELASLSQLGLHGFGNFGKRIADEVAPFLR